MCVCIDQYFSFYITVSSIIKEILASLLHKISVHLVSFLRSNLVPQIVYEAGRNDIT